MSETQIGTTPCTRPDLRYATNILRLQEWRQLLYHVRWIFILYTQPYPLTCTAFGTVSHHEHKRRRAPVATFYSRMSIATRAQPIITGNILKLCNELQQAANYGTMVNMRVKGLALANDNFTTYSTSCFCCGQGARTDSFILGFGSSSGYLDDAHAAQEYFDTVKALGEVTVIAKHYPWMIELSLNLPVMLVERFSEPLARFIRLHRVSVSNVARRT